MFKSNENMYLNIYDGKGINHLEREKLLYSFPSEHRAEIANSINRIAIGTQAIFNNRSKGVYNHTVNIWGKSIDVRFYKD